MSAVGQHLGPWVREHGWACAVIAAMALALVHAATWASPTYDEPAHLMRGLAYWWQADPRLSIAHPPLANAVAAIPGALEGPRIDLATLRGWEETNVGYLADAYFSRDYAVARRKMVAARLVVAALTVVLAIGVYVLCRRRLGRHTAVLAVLLLATQPVLLAHGSLDTTDLPVTVATFATVVATIAWLRGPGWKAVLWLGGAAGIAAATKMSGVLMGPIAIGLGGVWAALGWGRFTGSSSRRWGRLFAEALVVFGSMVVVVNAAYRGHETGLTVSELEGRAPPGTLARDPKFWERWSPLPDLPSAVPIPLPRTYLVGLASVRRGVDGGRRTFFLGRWRPAGSPAYFPVLLAVQLTAPVVSLLLVGAGLSIARLRGLRVPSRGTPSRGPPDAVTTLVVIGVFAVCILVVSARSKMNIGVRHVLPVVPLLVVLAASAAAALWGSRSVRSLRGGMVVGMLAASVVAALSAHPRHLGWFNVFAGGRQVGHRISLIGEDWGQDVADLARTAKREGMEPLWFFPYVPAVHLRELEFHGVQARRLRCKGALPDEGWIAVHANTIARGTCFPSLADDEPVVRINEHIHVYRASSSGGS